jgi:transposase
MIYGYSDDLRKAAISYYDRKHCTQLEVSSIFGIGVKTLSRWLRQRREDGTYVRKSQEKRAPYTLDEASLRGYISAQADAYLHEIAEQFSCHPTTIFYACKRLGISRKKNQPVSRARRD